MKSFKCENPACGFNDGQVRQWPGSCYLNLGAECGAVAEDPSPGSAAEDGVGASASASDSTSQRRPARSRERDAHRRGSRRNRDERDAPGTASDADGARDEDRRRRRRRDRGGDRSGGRFGAGAGAAIAAILLLVLTLGGGGYALYAFWPIWPFGASCDVARVHALADAGGDADDLYSAGSSCVQAGVREGKADAMVAGIRVLRLAAENGSADAAFEFGKLFDPGLRPDLEADAAVSELLPRYDAALAVRYYDRASKTIAAAGDNAARLRAAGNLPAPDGTQAGRDGRPLPDSEHPQLYQRILAKPGATVAAAPGAQGQSVKTFDLFYVFERRPGWVRVGRSSVGTAEGWMPEDKAQPWRVMLAMKFEPQGARGPALFFRDEMFLSDLLRQRDMGERAGALYAAAGSEGDRSPLVAVENQSVDWGLNPYLMPILAVMDRTLYDGQTIKLAKVASVAMPGVRGAPSHCADGATNVGTLRNEVVFVIDTTASMGPYIEGVKRIASEWRRRIESAGLDDQFRFGVVAYRNNMDAEPQRSGLEYVTNPVLPLGTGSTAARLDEAVRALQPAAVSTHSFNEDAAAGLKAAIDFGWSGCGTKTIFLVTDAGALAANDPKARHGAESLGLLALSQVAREADIHIVPVHIQTPEARQAGNVDLAANQYRTELGADRRYQLVRDGSTAGFAAYYRSIGEVITEVQKSKRSGRATRPSATGDVPRDMILNDLFAAQQRFLGAMAGATAPTFAETWTSDRDLSAPSRQTLSVALLLTRRELSELAAQTQYLITAAKAGQTESGRFFSLLQMVSAATAQDPRRFGAQSAQIGDMLPAFLKALDYRSEVLQLTASSWRDMQAQRQQMFVNKLEQKLRAYRQIEADVRNWRSLGSPDPNEAVALIPLKDLP